MSSQPRETRGILNTSTMGARKLLSLRENKNGSAPTGHKRDKSLESGQSKALRPAETLLSLFKPESARRGREEAAVKEKEASKIEDIASRLERLGIKGVDAEYIRTTLATKYASGDVERTVRFINFQQKAAAGTIVPYNRNIHMLGAENRGNVTCYLDALLFALFAKSDAFESMLKTEFEDEPRQKLCTLIRLWVNLLRSGELIYTDTTQMLQETLAECGWTEAKLLEQQDTSEAFNFITDKLELPLLSLKVDLYHQGKDNEEDDHKVIQERLLNLGIPKDPEGKGVKLEDCLEEYFNTQVNICRDSEDEKPPLQEQEQERELSPKATIRLVTDDCDGESADTVTNSPIQMSPSRRRSTTPMTGSQNEDEAGASGSRPSPRKRSTSVIQRVILDEEGRPKSVNEASRTRLQKAAERGLREIKVMTMPAWQFFRLMPWNASNGKTANGQPHNDDELAAKIRQKPVVGICLKRYMWTQDGRPKRDNTFIDIPDSLRLPYYMLDKDELVEGDPNGISTGHKLVLQSVVCHRGDSLQSGHYVAFARVDPKLLTDNRRHDSDPPPDYEEAQWVKFDDLRIEERVSYVAVDIKEALRDEMPYLLFYQIVPVPVVDMGAYSADEAEMEPPSYNDSRIDIAAPSPGPVTTEVFGMDSSGSPSQASSYFSSLPMMQETKPLNLRLSSDVGVPTSSRPPSDVPSNSTTGSRPESMALAADAVGDVIAALGVTPEGPSPAVTPGDEGTSQRISRTAAIFRGGSKSRPQSRPQSQAGDGRLSSTMKQIGGLMRTSKEPLRDAPTAAPLHATASAPPTVPSSEQGDEAHGENKVVGGEDSKRHHHHHRHHKKGKNKASTAAKKAGDTDRECTVM